MRALLLVPLLAAGCAAAKEKAIQDAMDRIWNEGDLSFIDERYPPELAWEIKQFVADNRALYPDLSITIDETVVSGPWIVTQWSVSGTHKDLHKPVKLEGVSMRRIEGGMIVEERMFYDLKTVYDQLGFTVVPPAGASPFEAAASRPVPDAPDAPPPPPEVAPEPLPAVPVPDLAPEDGGPVETEPTSAPG